MASLSQGAESGLAQNRAWPFLTPAPLFLKGPARGWSSCTQPPSHHQTWGCERHPPPRHLPQCPTTTGQPHWPAQAQVVERPGEVLGLGRRPLSTRLLALSPLPAPPHGVSGSFPWLLGLTGSCWGTEQASPVPTPWPQAAQEHLAPFPSPRPCQRPLSSELLGNTCSP